jgi:nucleoside-diphosphate-sugar epimerase
MQNSVLITGAEGFLGRAVTRLLENSGKQVIALDSVEATAVSNSASTTKVVVDVRNQIQMEGLLEQRGVGTIIHLAAILPTAAQRDPTFATQVNVLGSLNILELARRVGVRRLIFGSSLSIYGTYAEDHVVSEEDRAAPEDVYGAGKLYVERMGTAFASLHGMEFVSLRIGRVVGPGARSTTSAWRSEIFELLQTDHSAEVVIPYVGSERVLLVHVDEAARALATLFEADRLEQRIYNAPCESWVVNDLKQSLESLNSKIRVRLGDRHAEGNPRWLNWSRFRAEFKFISVPIAERLKNAANR